MVADADDREGETDLILPADAVEPQDIAQLRNDAGGLVCVALSDSIADTFDLPFLQSTLDHPAAAGHDIEYDERSSFSFTVNHRDTRTGITDTDRAKTISRLADLAAAPGKHDFAAEFRAPGHVHLLRAAPKLTANRQGHTELGLELAAAANRPPAVVVCEMLDDATGRARSKAAARRYARRHGVQYVDGAAIVTQLSN